MLRNLTLTDGHLEAQRKNSIPPTLQFASGI